jgi:hypothetical protein
LQETLAPIYAEQQAFADRVAQAYAGEGDFVNSYIAQQKQQFLTPYVERASQLSNQAASLQGMSLDAFVRNMYGMTPQELQRSNREAYGGAQFADPVTQQMLNEAQQMQREQIANLQMLSQNTLQEAEQTFPVFAEQQNLPFLAMNLYREQYIQPLEKQGERVYQNTLRQERDITGRFEDEFTQQLNTRTKFLENWDRQNPTASTQEREALIQQLYTPQFDPQALQALRPQNQELTFLKSPTDVTFPDITKAQLTPQQPTAQPAAQPVTQPATQPTTQVTTTPQATPVTPAPTASTGPQVAPTITQQPTFFNPFGGIPQGQDMATNPIMPTTGTLTTQSSLMPNPLNPAALPADIQDVFAPAIINFNGFTKQPGPGLQRAVGTGITGLQTQQPTAQQSFGLMPNPLNPAALPEIRSAGGGGTSAIDPTLRPYLELGLRGAEQLFLQQAPSLYPGQMYVSPSQQTLDALATQEAIARQPAGALEMASQAYGQGLGGLSFTSGGGFLGSNPFQQAAIQAATRPIMQQYENVTLPGISSMFSRAGRYGSGAMERTLGTAAESTARAIGDVSSTMAAQDYARERGLQQQALLGQITSSQAAPQIYGQQFLPSQQLGQVGAAREAIAAQPLQEAISRYQYQQQLPYQQLGGFLSSIYGTPMAGSQYAPQQTAQRNVGAGVLGGAALGAGVANMVGGDTGLFGFTPAQTGVGGAVLGGLLGGFA